MSKNLEAYLKLDKSKLKNLYVILIDGKVIAKGDDIEQMLENVKNIYPDRTPLVAKVPEERMLVL